MKDLLRDFLRLYRKSILAVLMLSVAAAGFQILSLIIAFDYINLLLQQDLFCVIKGCIKPIVYMLLFQHHRHPWVKL